MNSNVELSSNIEVFTHAGSINLGSTVQYFTLKPSADPDTNWGLKYLNLTDSEAELVDVTSGGFDSFKVHFSSKLPSQLKSFPIETQQAILAKQEAIFIVDIEDCSNSYDWRFYKDGLIMSLAENPFQYDISTQVVNSGKTLIITISNVTQTNSSNEAVYSDSDVVDFRFTATRFNKNGGGKLNEVFYSQDPRIVLNRV